MCAGPVRKMYERFALTMDALWPGVAARLGVNSLGGVGLHWMTEDWSDVGLGSTVWHDGGTYSSNSLIIMNAELNVGIVLLSNFLGDQATLFMPEQIALAAVNKWRCGGSEKRHTEVHGWRYG